MSFLHTIQRNICAVNARKSGKKKRMLLAVNEENARVNVLAASGKDTLNP